MSVTKLMTSDEVAERWGIKPETLKAWRHYGKGPKFVKIGRSVRYKLSDIEAFEKSHKRTA